MPEKASLVPIDNFGDLIALQEENKTLTYAQLQQEVKKRAARLKQYGILPGERIAYPFPSSIDSVVNYLSIIESGATAVLLDPHLPKEDLRKLILHSEPVALIGDFDLEIPCLKVEDLSSKTPYKKPQVETPPDPEVAMILYTSGTTGDYKGVLLTHDNVSHAIFLAKTVCEYPLGPGVPVECFLPIYHVFPLIVNILSFLSAGATIRFHPISDV
jgi:acyl-CoA synthetase (AMP-forming)/AMP-acid ligase II